MIRNVNVVVKVDQVVEPAGSGHIRVARDKQRPQILASHFQVALVLFKTIIRNQVRLVLVAKRQFDYLLPYAKLFASEMAFEWHLYYLIKVYKFFL